jgi:quinoprotein glucose dehydrogenase
MDLYAAPRTTARPVRWLFVGIAAAIATSASWSQEPYTTWRTYGGGGHSSQYSALDQIDKSNVARLEVAWSFPVGERSFVFNPIVVDSVMYVLARDNEIVALDAATGRELWAPERRRHARGMNYWRAATAPIAAPLFDAASDGHDARSNSSGFGKRPRRSARRARRGWT